MALSPSLTISIAADVASATITDTTVYGAPNADRADLRVFVKHYKVDTASIESALTLTSDTSDAQTDAVWTWTYDSDGYHKTYYVAIPEYSAATSYNIYDAVFDPATDLVYRSKSSGNVGQSLTDTNFYLPITDPASLAANYGEATESVNITSLVYTRVLTPLSQQAYGNLIGTNCACTDCDDDDIIPDYNIFSLWLNGAITADTRTEVLQGELICRRIESKFLSTC